MFHSWASFKAREKTVENLYKVAFQVSVKPLEIQRFTTMVNGLQGNLLLMIEILHDLVCTNSLESMAVSYIVGHAGFISSTISLAAKLAAPQNSGILVIVTHPATMSVGATEHRLAKTRSRSLRKAS